MSEVENYFDPALINTHPWQNSTIEEQIVINDSVCITISPSQFRSLLSSTANSVSFARHILQFVCQRIRSSQIIILIADQIQKHNIAVFEHKNEKCALKVATSLGQKIADFFSKALDELSLNGSQKIKIISWKDMLSSSDYNSRVEDIQQYVINHEHQCGLLLDKVCEEYTRARNPRKHLKKKESMLLREYVLHELPALLNGVDYGEHTYKFMLHPVLKSNNSNETNQREAMAALLNHMREHYLPENIDATSTCHIFDVEIPCSLIMSSDESLTGSSRSSFSSSDISITNLKTLEESSESDDNISGYLWLILILQLVSIIVYHFLLQIFFIGIFMYGIYSVYTLLIRQISKRGEWYSTLDGSEQQVLGTKYQSFFGDLPGIQSSQNGTFSNDLYISFGHPQVYRIWMGPEPALMLADLRAVKDFWSHHNEKCVERNVHLGWPLEMLMGNGVGFRSIQDRNRITKFFHKCFGPTQVRQFNMHLETTVSEFFEQHSSDTLQCQDIKYLIHDAAVHVFLGNVGFDYLKELHSLVDELGELMIEAFDARWTNLPFIGYYLLPSSYKLRNRIRLFNKRIRDVLSKIIDIYRQSPSINNDDIDDENAESISLLNYFACDPNPSITFDELTDTIVEGLLAPNDGTAGTFMYTLLLRAMHPDIQEKTRQEIRNAEDLTLKSLSNITYLDQVLSECQRLCPIFMFNVPEFSSQSMTIGGIHIPKNAMVMLDVVSLNHNQDAWGPDPLNFRPERFAAPISSSTLKSYHGFGNGHLRRCLGQYLVKNLHRLILSHVLSKKEIRLTTNIKNINDMERCRLPFIYVPTQPI